MDSSSLASMFLLVLLLYSCRVEGQRLKDVLYETIDGAYACFRRLNGTHQFGCTSSRSGNVGVVHFIENQEESDWLINHGLAGPYVAVLHPSMFKKSLLLSLQASGKVSGVALINSNGSAERPPSFSHEDSCPNRYSGLSSLQAQTCGSGENLEWNSFGTSMLLMSWDFPIFYITDQSHINRLYDCYKEHNVVSHPADQLDRALCSLELKSHMFAAVDSKKCIKRNSYKTLFSQVNSCDPLGGRNIWQTLFPRSTHKSDSAVDPKSIKEDADGSIAVLAARMDGASMFDGIVPSALGAATGMVTLIATAELLHRMIPQTENYDKNVLFLLFTGESYDYIGSSRVAFDMKHGLFPVVPDPNVAQPPTIGLHQIGPFIELSQLRKPAPDQPLYVHRLKDSDKTKNLVKILQRNGKDAGILISDKLPASKNLPPASLQSFLAEKPDIPGVVLTEHGAQYSNSYYHGVFDDVTALNYRYANKSDIPKDSLQAYLTNLTTALANTLHEHVTNQPYVGAALVDPELVDELLHCYLEQNNCSLFQSAVAGNSISEKISYYVGVPRVYTLLSVLTGAAIALLTGSPTNFNQTDCHNNASTDQVYQYIWVSSKWDDPNSTKVCLQTTMNYSAAVSPAFIIDGYDMDSGNYSTWTESVWPELTAKMFLKPSFRQEVMTLSLGVTVLIMSFAGVLFVKVRKEVLFNPGLPST